MSLICNDVFACYKILESLYEKGALIQSLSTDAHVSLYWEASWFTECEDEPKRNVS
jgi:hypothetical protein